MRYNRRQGYINDNDIFNSSILLEDFIFYNKKKIISHKILSDIQNKLINENVNLLYWTNSKFARFNAGFKFEKIIHNGQHEIVIEIIELKNKFKVSDFNSCKYILFNNWFILFDLTKEERLNLNDKLYDINESKIKIFISMEEIQEYIIVHNIIKNYSADNFDEYCNDINFLFNLDKSWRDKFIYFKEIKEVSEKEIFNFFRLKETNLTYSPKGWSNTALENYKKYINDTETKLKDFKILNINFIDGRNLYRHKIILKVIEKRFDDTNYRIALIQDLKSYNINYSILIISDKHLDYTSIDENVIFFKVEKRYFYDLQTNQYSGKTLNINSRLYDQIEDNIDSLLSNQENTITPMIYNFYKERISINFKYNDLNKRDSKIIEQYQKLLDEKKSIKIDNVIISKNLIKVIDERFSLEFDDNFINIVDQLHAIKETLTKGDAKYNFNILYEELLKLSIINNIRMNNVKSVSYSKIKEISFKVNGMKINILKENNRFSINGIFCRIVDVYYILTKIICYNDIEIFNKYVKEVSHIGIQWKKLINDGVQIELKNPFTSFFRRTGIYNFDNTYMRFTLCWDIKNKSKVYLILNKKKYLIRYKNKFKKYFNMPKRFITMAQLKKELNECLDKLDTSIIIDIVENAIEEAKVVKQRGQELVAETIKNINAEKIEEEIQGHTQRGYIFKGRQSGIKYFVNKTNLDVYRNDNGIWNRRCIVNDHSKERIFEDKLANRLINIYNEPSYLKSFLGV